MNKDYIGELIRRGRQQLGWTQSDLARRIGTGQQTLSRWERGITAPDEAAMKMLTDVLSLQDDGGPRASVLGGQAHAPVRPLVPNLPLGRLAPEQFEGFAADLIALRHPGSEVHRYGSQGHRQEGIDLYAEMPDGTVFDYQCKRHQQFGPKKVQQAVTAYRRDAEHHYLVLGRDSASPGARKAMDKHPDWTLLDGDDIARIIRNELAQDDAARLIDTYFPGGWREHFLGLPDPGPWLTPTEFFLPLEGRERTFSHSWTMVGRISEIESIVSELDGGPSPAFVLSGHGGIGKSRLLKAVANALSESHPTLPVRFLSPGSTIEMSHLDRLPRGSLTLIVDDAHDRDDLESLIALVSRGRPEARLLFVTRPYGVARIVGQLRHNGLIPIDMDPVLTLGDLKLDDLVSLSNEILATQGGHQHLAAPIAELTKDCPLLTVVGSFLVAREQISPALLGNREEFRQTIFSAFRDAITGGIGDPGDEPGLRRVLELVAILQPVRPDDEFFGKISEAVTSLPQDRVARHVGLLHEAGVLLRRGRMMRVVPDLLGDFLVGESCLGSAKRTSTTYADRVFSEVQGPYFENLLLNIGKLDWQVSSSKGLQTNLLDQIWRSTVEVFRRSAILGRETLLRQLSGISFFQPERTLDLVRVAIEEPVNEVEEDYRGLFEDYHVDYSTVLDAIPPVLQGVAYHLNFVPEVSRLLWELGRNDERPTNSHPDHAMRVLTEIAGYEPNKPIAYNRRVVEVALRWLDDPYVTSYTHSPFDVLEPILATEGHETSSAGNTVTFSPFAIEPASVKPLRKRVIDEAFERLESDDLALAARAIQFLEEALRGPTGMFGREVSDEEKRKWLPDKIEVLSRLEKAVKELELDPVLLNEIQSAVSWHVRYAKGKTKQSAQAVWDSIPDTILFRLTYVLAHTWAISIRYEADDYRDAERKLQERREVVAQELLDAYSSEEIMEVVVERLRALEVVKKTQTPSPGPLIHALCSKAPELATAFIAEVLSDPDNPLAEAFPSLLGVLRSMDSTSALSVARESLEQDRLELIRGVAQAYSWGIRGEGQFLSSDEQAFVMELARIPDDVVQATMIHASPAIASFDRSRALGLLLSIIQGCSGKVLGEALMQFGERGTFQIGELSSDDKSAIRSKLLDVEKIGGYQVGHFLGELSVSDPLGVVKLLMARVERYPTVKNGDIDYRPIPYGWEGGFPLRIRESREFLTCLRLIRKWVTEGEGEHPHRRTYGPYLFSSVAGTYDEAVLSVLRETLSSDDPAQVAVIGRLLSEAASGFLWHHSDFVIELLEKAWQLGRSCYNSVATSLHRAAISGIRSGTPGQPFPEDVELRDRAGKLATELLPGSPAQRFFEDLNRSAQQSIKFSLERDEELLL